MKLLAHAFLYSVTLIMKIHIKPFSLFGYVTHCIIGYPIAVGQQKHSFKCPSVYSNRSQGYYYGNVVILLSVFIPDHDSCIYSGNECR